MYKQQPAVEVGGALFSFSLATYTPPVPRGYSCVFTLTGLRDEVFLRQIQDVVDIRTPRCFNAQTKAFLPLLIPTDNCREFSVIYQIVKGSKVKYVKKSAPPQLLTVLLVKVAWETITPLNLRRSRSIMTALHQQFL